MKSNYLFPHRYKKWGWIFFIPSAILGFIVVVTDYAPAALTFNLPSLSLTNIFKEAPTFTLVQNNILNEILGIATIISALLVAFSKEKIEDEFIEKTRLNSLVWATYINYAVLLISFFFVFDFSFLWIMIFNMFTLLVFFIVRFNWQVRQLNKSLGHEE